MFPLVGEVKVFFWTSRSYQKEDGAEMNDKKYISCEVALNVTWLTFEIKNLNKKITFLMNDDFILKSSALKKLENRSKN